MESRKITFSPPDITELEIQEVSEALRSGWITTGPRVKEFEKKLGSSGVMVGKKYPQPLCLC